MNKILSVLKALKLFDPDNTLSLSNVAFLVIISKIAMTQSIDWTVIVPFALTLLNHNAKKHWRVKDQSKSTQDAERLAKVEQQMRDVMNAQAFRK